MEVQTAIQQIFNSRPEKWLRGQTVKELLRLKLGYLPTDSEYRKEFMTVRETFTDEQGRRILKFWTLNHWYYSLSNNSMLICKHNYALEKLRDNALKRKIHYSETL